MVAAPVRLVPPICTPWLEPLFKGELTEVIVGGGGSTLKTTAPVVPPGVVTVILRFPWVAAAVMVKVAVICVELTTVRPETVMPVKPAGLALMAVAPVRLVPVRVTTVVRPAGLDVGMMLLRVGTMPNATELL